MENLVVILDTAKVNTALLTFVVIWVLFSVVVGIILARALKKPIYFWGMVLASDRLVEEKQKPVFFEGQIYEQDRFDDSLYYSLADRSLRVREILNPKNKDKIILATSHPHLFDGDQLKTIRESIPYIVFLQAISSHELAITKSPAANYFDFGGELREMVIHHLNDKYRQG